MKRASIKEPVLVNQVTSQDEENLDDGDITGEPDEDGQDPIEFMEVEINKTVSKARQEAHPGDVRRVLSGNPKKKQPT